MPSIHLQHKGTDTRNRCQGKYAFHALNLVQRYKAVALLGSWLPIPCKIDKNGRRCRFLETCTLWTGAQNKRRSHATSPLIPLRPATIDARD